MEESSNPPGFENWPVEQKQAFLDAQNPLSSADSDPIPSPDSGTAEEEIYARLSYPTSDPELPRAEAAPAPVGKPELVQTAVKKYKEGSLEQRGAALVAILGNGESSQPAAAEHHDPEPPIESPVTEQKAEQPDPAPTENRLPPRKGFGPVIAPEASEQPIIEKKEEEKIEPEAKPEVSINAEAAQKSIESQAKIEREVGEGDSLWGILEKELSTKEGYSELSQAQKIYALSSIINEMFASPSDYGLREEGSLQIGDKLDLTEVAGDEEGIKALFEKARQTIASGSAQEKLTIGNREKIEKWVSSHAGEEVDESKIWKILSNKPEASKEPEIKEEPVQELPNEEQKAEQPLEPAIEAQLIPPDAEKQLKEDIEIAKQRISVLQNGKVPDEPERNPNLERTFYSDTKMAQDIDNAFRSEVELVYGSSGILGMGKESGLNSKEWREIARLPAIQVVKFRMEDSMKSGLPPETIKSLSKSKKHQKFMEQMKGLLERADGAVKPFERETVEQFLKRLGGYVLKTYQQKAVINLAA